MSTKVMRSWRMLLPLGLIFGLSGGISNFVTQVVWWHLHWWNLPGMVLYMGMMGMTGGGATGLGSLIAWLYRVPRFRRSRNG